MANRTGIWLPIAQAKPRKQPFVEKANRWRYNASKVCERNLSVWTLFFIPLPKVRIFQIASKFRNLSLQRNMTHLSPERTLFSPMVNHQIVLTCRIPPYYGCWRWGKCVYRWCTVGYVIMKCCFAKRSICVALKKGLGEIPLCRSQVLCCVMVPIESKSQEA